MCSPHVLSVSGDFDGAEILAQRALEIRLRSMGPGHADVAHSLHNLSLISRAKASQTGRDTME